MKIDLDYADFKAVVTERTLFWQFVEKGSSSYLLFCIDNPIEYCCDIAKGTSEATDFETNYKADANRPLNIAASSSTSYFGSKQISIEANGSCNFCEWQFEHDVYFNKMMPVYGTDAVWGDYAQVTIHLPDGTPIKEYSDKLYCVGKKPDGWMQGVGAGLLPEGLLLRVTYTKADGDATERKVAIWAEFLI